MSHTNEKEKLDQLLASVRQRIFHQTFTANLVQFSLAALPLAAALIAFNRRWSDTPVGFQIGLFAVFGVVVAAFFAAYNSLARNVEAALALDSNAKLKDRITSAHQFIDEGRASEAHALQIRDAIDHADRVNARAVMPISLPRHSRFLPLALLAFILSFMVPPAFQPQEAEASIPETKQLQLAELESLREELLAEEEDEELADVVKKLKELEKQFEEGELNERDLMLELGRLNEQLEKKVQEFGVENLEAELNTMVPHMMAAAPTAQAATAIKEDQLEKAAEELEKLAEKMEQEKLTPEEKQEMKTSMRACAAKLGQKSNNSFGGDLAKATEALEKSDAKSFASACKSMGDKMKLCKKVSLMKSACKKVGNCKACIGQCNSNKIGKSLTAKKSNNDSNNAGSASSNDPLGERDRLKDSYRNMLQVSGMAGEGPVETEIEITEGQLSDSQLQIKKLHANFSEVAEEAIENEAIPLSHRYHVKRYFQTIKPTEE